MAIDFDQTEKGIIADNSGQSQNNPTVKKAYEKPEVVYRAPLETMAATCTNTGAKSSVGLGCNASFLNS